MNRTEVLINEFLSELPEPSRTLYRELAEYAVSLGYTPKKTKTQSFALDFSKAAVRKTILKLEAHDNGIERSGPGLRMKFYACDQYSEIFQNAVRRVIEAFGGKYTGCYGCGRCKDQPEGYTYVYPDGRTVFRCGSELISVPGFGSEHLEQFRSLLSRQDAFFTGQAVPAR